MDGDNGKCAVQECCPREKMYCTLRYVAGQVLDGSFLVALLVFLVLLHFTSPYKVYFASFLFEHFVTQSHIIFYGIFNLLFVNR